jgi:hypothetical protein
MYAMSYLRCLLSLQFSLVSSVQLDFTILQLYILAFYDYIISLLFVSVQRNDASQVTDRGDDLHIGRVTANLPSRHGQPTSCGPLA